MEEIINVRNGQYTLKGRFSFDTDRFGIKMDAQDALEIAYTLFDWANMPYDILDELQERMED